MDGWVCGVAGTRLAEAPPRLCSLILSAKPHCSASEALLTPPTPRIPFLFFPLLVVKGKKKKEQAELTGIIQPPWLVRGGINESQGSWLHMIQTCVIEDGCSLKKD